MWTGWPCATLRSSSTGPVVKAILSWKYYLAFAALVILSLVTMTPLLVILKGKITPLFLPPAGNQSSGALKAHIRPGPVKENDEPVPEADQKKDVDEDPDDPGYKTGKHNPVEVHDSRGSTNGGHRAQVHIMEGFGWQPLAYPENIARGMPSFLHSDRGEAGEQLSCLIHKGGQISNDKDLRMAGNAQIRVDQHTPDVIKRHAKGARQRGWRDTCRPKDSAGAYRLSACHDHSLTDRCHWRILHDLDAQPL